MTELIVGLVSISDRASAGVYKDEGIPALKEWLDGGDRLARLARRDAPDRRRAAGDRGDAEGAGRPRRAATWC